MNIPYQCDKCHHRGHNGNCGEIKSVTRQYSLCGVTSQTHRCNCCVWLTKIGDS